MLPAPLLPVAPRVEWIIEQVVGFSLTEKRIFRAAACDLAFDCALGYRYILMAPAPFEASGIIGTISKRAAADDALLGRALPGCEVGPITIARQIVAILDLVSLVVPGLTLRFAGRSSGPDSLTDVAYPAAEVVGRCLGGMRPVDRVMVRGGQRADGSTSLSQVASTLLQVPSLPSVQRRESPGG